MPEVITSLEQVTAAWLTAALRRSGALAAGAVSACQVQEWQVRELSANARLKVSYTAGARGERPPQLFLKMVSLLADLSATHTAARGRPVTRAYGLALAEGLAAMHAHWWGRSRLERGGEPIPDAAAIERFAAIARPGLPRLLDCCAGALKPHWSQVLYDTFAYHPGLMIARSRDGRGFTLIHGDVSPGNIQVPLAGERPLYIIDRGPFDWSLTTWLGVYDLAYLSVLYWQAERRRQLEEPVLRHYHEQFKQRGVEDYGWDQLYQDYRLSAAMCLYVATEWCRGDGFRQWQSAWLPMLRQALIAFDDLECEKLWAS